MKIISKLIEDIFIRSIAFVRAMVPMIFCAKFLAITISYVLDVLWNKLARCVV
jgi:hypothetical protein